MSPISLVAALLVPLLSGVAAPLAAAASPVAAGDPWRPPVTPLVVERPFLAPAGPYAPGHRGVDIHAIAGAVVRAPAPGLVVVAGRIAGKAVVSISHPHRILGRTGWRTTYEGVHATVTIGERVQAGQPIGTVIAHAHSGGIHWGLKRGRDYADPLLLLRRPVILKPLRG